MSASVVLRVVLLISWVCVVACDGEEPEISSPMPGGGAGTELSGPGDEETDEPEDDAGESGEEADILTGPCEGEQSRVCVARAPGRCLMGRQWCEDGEWSACGRDVQPREEPPADDDLENES